MAWRPSYTILFCLIAVAGCASQNSKTTISTPNLFKPPPPTDNYELSKVELGYDCPKLTGHMKVRISQMRATADREPSTAASRTMHQMGVVTGASPQGADPAADRARDRVMLEAFNRQLAAKNCKPLDLDAELAGTPTPGGGRSNTAKANAPAGKS